MQINLFVLNYYAYSLFVGSLHRSLPHTDYLSEQVPTVTKHTHGNFIVLPHLKTGPHYPIPHYPDTEQISLFVVVLRPSNI